LKRHPEIVVTKLVSNKVTFVHHKLWPALYSLGTAREPWQMDNLSIIGQDVLNLMEKEGPLRTDHLLRWGNYGPKALSAAVIQLEKVLLLHSDEIHTEAGKHAKHLETWPQWASRVGFRAEKMMPQQAKNELARILEEVNQQFGAKGKLPWS
jgi:hypothetical protein